MKIELIFPALQKRARPLGRSTVPPLGLTMVAALTPPGVDVSLTDENVTPVDLDADTLERGTRWAWQAFYSLPSTWERLGARQRHVLALWVINLYMRWFFIRARNRRRLSLPPALG